MSAFTDALRAVAAKAETAIPVRDGDYRGADGLLFCGKCHSPKQCRPFPGCDLTVFCLCKCEQEQDRAVHEQLRRKEYEQQREICFSTSDLLHARFAQDDGKNPRLTEICKQYAQNPGSRWLLLWGDTGTGKSFMAACIANAAIDAGQRARFVTVPEIEQELWKERDKSAVYDALNSVGLLVIDDFGCERRTEYMDEIRFNLIDGRLRSGKPCVITTNLTLQDFAAPKDLTQKRIVSRLFERVTAFHVAGEDRRFAALKARRAVPAADSLRR